MRGDLLNLNIKAINKQSSGLIVKHLEIPHNAYSSRYASAQKRIQQCRFKKNRFIK